MLQLSQHLIVTLSLSAVDALIAAGISSSLGIVLACVVLGIEPCIRRFIHPSCPLLSVLPAASYRGSQSNGPWRLPRLPVIRSLPNLTWETCYLLVGRIKGIPDDFVGAIR